MEAEEAELSALREEYRLQKRLMDNHIQQLQVQVHELEVAREELVAEEGIGEELQARINELLGQVRGGALGV